MAQAFCHVCFGTSLNFENGVLVCDTCGTQTQTFQEEAEYQVGIDDTRGKRRAAGSSGAAQQSQATLLAREEELATQRLQTAALAYVRCLQQLLKAQAEVLTTRFGVSSQVASVLRQLWLSHLPSTGMLEPRPRQPAAAAAAREAAGGGSNDGSDDMDVDGDDDDDGEQAGEQRITVLVAPVNMKRLFWKLLHPQVTLQICFLGCALLREAVSVYDIITWALDAQLPYLALPDIATQCLSDAEAAALPIRCIQPEVSKSPLKFYNSSCQLADVLGVQLPNAAGEALLCRTVRELALPQAALDLALELYAMYLVQSPRMRLVRITKAAQDTPYVWLAAVMLIACKLLFGLGNTPGMVEVVPKAPGPPGGWQAWAQTALQHLPGITNMPLSEEQACALDPVAKRHYINYCRHHMFAGHPVVPSFEDIQRTLLGWYDASATAEANAAAAAAAAAAGQASQGSQQQQQPGGQQPSAGTSSASGLLPGGTPADAAASYSLAVIGLTKAAGTYKLAPDLAAVVVVLSAFSRCTHASLLDCVKVVERQMVAVEAGVAILKQLHISDGPGDGGGGGGAGAGTR